MKRKVVILSLLCLILGLLSSCKTIDTKIAEDWQTYQEDKPSTDFDKIKHQYGYQEYEMIAFGVNENRDWRLIFGGQNARTEYLLLKDGVSDISLDEYRANGLILATQFVLSRFPFTATYSDHVLVVAFADLENTVTAVATAKVSDLLHLRSTNNIDSDGIRSAYIMSWN